MTQNLQSKPAIWGTSLRVRANPGHNARHSAGRSRTLSSTNPADALAEMLEIERSKGLDLRDGDGVRLIFGHDLSTHDHVMVEGKWQTAPMPML
jgi:hypothetical protein